MARVEFFISYAGFDQAWAEWIARWLEAARHTTSLQAWDFEPGSDFVYQMEQALRDVEPLLIVLSPAYRASRVGKARRPPMFANDSAGNRGLLLTVRVAECNPPELLITRLGVDLVGLADAEGGRAAAGRPPPGAALGPTTDRAGLPGAAVQGGLRAQSPFPGSGPSSSKMGPRITGRFTGSTELPEQLKAAHEEGIP
jgi:TIR domain